jgi:hypothetical protein
MEVAFKTRALAALCNSERRLAERWGEAAARAVGRRLLELAASDADCLDRLPGATVSTDGSGVTIIAFGEVLVVHGIISSAGSGHRAARGDAERILITRLDVPGGGS